MKPGAGVTCTAVRSDVGVTSASAGRPSSLDTSSTSPSGSSSLASTCDDHRLIGARRGLVVAGDGRLVDPVLVDLVGALEHRVVGVGVLLVLAGAAALLVLVAGAVGLGERCCPTRRPAGPSSWLLVTHAAPVSRSLTQIQPFTSRRRSEVPVTPSSGVVWSVTPSHVRVSVGGAVTTA